MAIVSWAVKPENEITDTTKIKEADNKLQATVDDLVTWVNGTGGYVGTGLKYDAELFLAISLVEHNANQSSWQTEHDAAMLSRSNEWTTIKGNWQTEYNAIKVVWNTQLQSIVDDLVVVEW